MQVQIHALTTIDWIVTVIFDCIWDVAKFHKTFTVPTRKKKNTEEKRYVIASSFFFCFFFRWQQAPLQWVTVSVLLVFSTTFPYGKKSTKYLYAYGKIGSKSSLKWNNQPIHWSDGFWWVASHLTEIASQKGIIYLCSIHIYIVYVCVM